MRYLILHSLFLAALCCAATAQDATLVKQTSDAPPAGAPFKPEGYQDPKTGETIVLTGPGELVHVMNGKTRAGKYTVEGTKMHVVFEDGGETGDSKTVRHIYDVVDGGLQDDEYGQVLLNGAAFNDLKVGRACLSNAKQIALACRLYASDNEGKFPKNLADLMPTYLQDEKLFVSPLSAKKEAMGYEYLGAGGTDSDDPSKVLLRSKDTLKDGRRIIVRFDSSGAIMADPKAEAAPAKPLPELDKTVFKPVVYQEPVLNWKIVITGPKDLYFLTQENNPPWRQPGQFSTFRPGDTKHPGAYVIADKKMHVTLPADDGKTAKIDYDIAGDGLHDEAGKDVFLTDAVMEKTRNDWLCLSGGKQMALACRLYASDHNGNFPAKLDDLVPSYIIDTKYFASPLSAKKEAVGYDYFGGKDTDAASKILLQSKDVTADGKRIIIHPDGSGEFKADK